VAELKRSSVELRYRIAYTERRRSTLCAIKLWAAKARVFASRRGWIERRQQVRRVEMLTAAISYWCAEAQWRIERQRWMWRQVRYMQELQTVLEQAGDGQRLAKRLLQVGVEPGEGRSEQQIRAGRKAISRSTAALERAIRRDASPRSRRRALGAARAAERTRDERTRDDRTRDERTRDARTRDADRGASHSYAHLHAELHPHPEAAAHETQLPRKPNQRLRVLGEGIDAYLEDYTPATRRHAS